MTIIDNKGRLFGKVNLLDLLVVLVVLAVAARFGYQYMNPTSALPAGTDKTIEVTLLVPAVRQPTIDQLTVGALVIESKTGEPLGKIVAVTTQPAKIRSDAGEYESKFAMDAFVTVSGTARIASREVTVDGNTFITQNVLLNRFPMNIGAGVNMVVGDWRGTGVTWEINQNPQPRK